MKSLDFLVPFGRLRRAGFLLTMLLSLAGGWVSLAINGIGGIYRSVGLVLFVFCLWLLLSSMINRTRDADASAGWVLMPVLVTAGSAFIIAKMGYLDFSDFILPSATMADKIVSAPFRPFIMVLSAIVPILFAMAISAFFWLLSFIALAVLPSRRRP